MENLTGHIDKATEMLIEYGPKLILAILVLIIGLAVIRSLSRFLAALLEKRKLDPTLKPFFVNLVSWGLKAMLVISVASMVGIETTSFVAVIGAAGLAVGLALQGSLANLAGGVLLLIFRPFKKGDFIVAQGEEGTVEKIDIFATVIHKLDNQIVIIPNGPLIGGVIRNVTGAQKRRVDLSVGISYGDDIKKACECLTQMCLAHPKVLKDPAPFVGVIGYGDSSIDLTIRPWTNTEDYWDVFFQLNEQIKSTLDQASISIPFPQRDIHMINHKG
ncbi:MAG: mechanosensitive ion channel [Bdellovibrionales bacterium]|nr:mechanosensitive ion channel [Bdellovibrionales bacterium]